MLLASDALLHAGYCGLVKASEDDSILQPMSSPMDMHTENDAGLSPAASEAASQQDVSSEAVGSPLGPAPAGMQFAKQAFDQPTAVTIGYSARHDSAEHLQMKLESLQKAEDLSAAGTHGQQVRIAEEAFAQALQSLEQGDVAAAVNLLKVAQAACPASKPQAQARIILLLGRCQQMTGPAKPATAPAMTTSAKSAAPSQTLPDNSYMQHSAQTSGHIKHSSNEVDANVEDGDEQKADQSFQSGLEALNRYIVTSYTHALLQLLKVEYILNKVLYHCSYYHLLFVPYSDSCGQRPCVCTGGIWQQLCNTCKMPEHLAQGASQAPLSKFSASSTLLRLKRRGRLRPDALRLYTHFAECLLGSLHGCYTHWLPTCC